MVLATSCGTLSAMESRLGLCHLEEFVHHVMTPAWHLMFVAVVKQLDEMVGNLASILLSSE